MNKPIIIIGIGELGGVFARAFLRKGHPVYPIIRGMDIDFAAALPDPQLVLVAVAEKDFSSVMKTIPNQWRNRLVLLQNELLPHDWEAHNIINPTVISVWFEKKKGMDYNPILPSPVYGPMAGFIADSMDQIGIPCNVLGSRDDLVFALVMKNVFVFTINISGLVLAEGTTTFSLWDKNQRLALDVANDIVDLQEAITGKSFSRDRLRESFAAAIKGDPNHKCRGRSASGRLKRVVALADDIGLQIQTIRDLFLSLKG